MYPLHLRVDGFTQLTNATGRFYTTKAKGVDGSTQLDRPSSPPRPFPGI